MKVRKLLSGALALGLAMSMGMTAFAADADSVTIKKSYKLVTSEGTGASSPAETFELEQVGNGEVSGRDVAEGEAAPSLSGGSVTYAEGAATAAGAEKEITINLPTYNRVGIYTYSLKEKAGTTAGVTYLTTPIKLVVTVTNGPDGNLVRTAAVHTETGGAKSDTFENTYTAGALQITKTVTGNLGDKKKYFEFKVTLNGESGKTYAETYAVTGGSYEGNPASVKIGTETTFKLKDGDTIKIANLPAGVTYTVTETAATGYTTTKSGDTGSITDKVETAAFTNEREEQIDTGIRLDSLPYLMLLAIAGAGVVVFAVRKRSLRED